MHIAPSCVTVAVWEGSQMEQATSYMVSALHARQHLAWHSRVCTDSGLPHGQGYREGFAGLPDSDDDSASESPPTSAALGQATASAAPMEGNNASRQDGRMRTDGKEEAVLNRDGTPSGSQEAAGGRVGDRVKRHHP